MVKRTGFKCRDRDTVLAWSSIGSEYSGVGADIDGVPAMGRMAEELQIPAVRYANVIQSSAFGNSQLFLQCGRSTRSGCSVSSGVRGYGLRHPESSTRRSQSRG